MGSMDAMEYKLGVPKYLGWQGDNAGELRYQVSAQSAQRRLNPIGLVAIEIQPHFQSGRSRGLVDIAEPRRRVNGVMASI